MLPRQHQSEVRVADEPNGDRHDRVVDATGERLLTGKTEGRDDRAKGPARRPTNPPTSRVWRTGRRPLARPRATVQSNGHAAWPATSRSNGRSPSSDRFAVSPAAKTTPRLTRRSSPSGRQREPTFSRPRHEACGIRAGLVVLRQLAQYVVLSSEQGLNRPGGPGFACSLGADRRQTSETLVPAGRQRRCAI